MKGTKLSAKLRANSFGPLFLESFCMMVSSGLAGSAFNLVLEKIQLLATSF